MRTFCFIFCSKKNIKIKDFDLRFRLQSKVVFIPILNIRIGFLGLKTCSFINFVSFFEVECVHFLYFLIQKNIKIKDFGLGFPLQEKLVFIPILKIRISFLGVKACIFFIFFQIECVNFDSCFVSKKHQN